MSVKPDVVKLTATSVDVLNAIRDNASEAYRGIVPRATGSQESIRAIGNVITSYPAMQNEFFNAIINRIGRVYVTSKTYENPWAMFKKGMLEFGEVIEEIFVNMAKPFEFDPVLAETNLFKREIPDVKAAFHIMNYQKFYKSTISNEQLRQAFLSWQGITDLIAKIVDSMYTAANYDEFITMKYMLARRILDGLMYPTEIPTVETANMKKVVSTVKGLSNKFEFQSTKYNLAGVYNHTLKRDQIVLINSQFDAEMDVEVLASAFNMSKAEFMGNRVLVDSFGELDVKRLRELFAKDPTYNEPTIAELTALDNIPVILVDRDWFMIFDNFMGFTENYNGEGLNWQYFYHVWKTFSVSPYANNSIFVQGVPAVNTVTVSPATMTLAKGQVGQFGVTVNVTNFAPKGVVWTVDSELSTIDSTGKLIVSPDELALSIIVTATSTFDETKTGTAVVTVS